MNAVTDELQSGDVKTMVIQCAPGTGSDECGFPEPITYTAGPSTVHFSPSGIYQVVGEYDCKITGTSVVACALTEGLYSTMSNDDYITTPAASSSTTSTTASGTDVTFIDVTITAGARAGGAGTNVTSSGSSARSTGASGSQSGASGRATSASASASATSNGASQRSGLVAMMLAAPLFLL